MGYPCRTHEDAAPARRSAGPASGEAAPIHAGLLRDVFSCFPRSLFDNPLHPYTKALLGAIPIPDPDIPAMQDMLEGDVPSPINPPKGCCFHTRCHGCCKECTAQKPKLINVGNDHWVACCKV